MNISLNKIDAVTGIIKLDIVKDDYAEKVDKNLRDFRKKANMPGFRKGMVPLGIVKKMYGKSILVEEINHIVSENLVKYIDENNLDIMGEPLPNESEQPKIDFDTQEDFEFVFDISFKPEINLTLSKRDKLPYYEVAVSDDMIKKQVENYRASYGTYEDVDTVVDDTDMLKGLLTELEDGQPKAGGIVVEDGTLMSKYMRDEDEKKKFVGAAKGSTVVFNPNKAYEGHHAELNSLLKIKIEETGEVTSDFSFEIREITHYKEAEMNQEFFDKIFGDGTVKSEEEFTERVKSNIASQFAPQSDYRFLLDARKHLLKKAGKVAYNDKFLKRWLVVANEKSTEDQINEEYPKLIEDLTYQLIQNKIIKENELKIEQNDVADLARQVARSQFAQYGMMNIPDDIVENYANDLMKNKEVSENIINRAMEQKFSKWLKERVKLDVKEVTAEEFDNLFKEDEEKPVEKEPAVETAESDDKEEIAG